MLGDVPDQCGILDDALNTVRTADLFLDTLQFSLDVFYRGRQDPES